MLHLGQNIKLIRGLSKLTQGELGELVGENTNNIKAYETRGISPKPHVVMFLAQLAGVKEEDLKNKKLTLKDISINADIMTTYTKTPVFEAKISNEQKTIREQAERIKELQSQVEKLMEMLYKALEKR